MCGISGIVLPDRARRGRLDAPLIERMRDVLRHRGPDDAGIYLQNDEGGRVGLGHRRLSIVDVAGGHQPMSNEDESLTIVYNGEIYNHTELRARLEARGHRYRTRCDTETILHLYEEVGPRVVESLRGMFAFAIWDRRRRELFLARDRLGVKPLYYVAGQDGSLYFASEIKALLAADAVTPEMNYAALPDYLANRATSGEETLFQGVQRLLPGHTLRWRDGQIQVDQYWDIRYDVPAGERGRSRQRGPRFRARRTERESIEEWSHLFENSVRLRLMSDVPLGMFLSGGIDSSAICAVMSRMVDAPVKTFSVAYPDRDANELEHARLVSEAFGTEHHEVMVQPSEFMDLLPRLIWHEDEPMAGPASVPLYVVSRLAGEHVKVVLTGEGSDEQLAGYGRFRSTLWNLAVGLPYQRYAPARLRREVARAIDGLPLLAPYRQKLGRTFLKRSLDLESIYFDNFAVYPRPLLTDLLTEETRDRAGGVDPYRHHRCLMADTNAPGLLDRLLYLDMKTYLHELLMKQDQMSMAASIESRVPFLDHHLVEFTAGLPLGLKLRGRTSKYVLRKAMQGVLPPSILTRPKMGFPDPLCRWFRGPLRPALDEYVLGERAMRRGLFDPFTVRRLVGEHHSGHFNHTERLWALMNLEIWQRQFLDGEAVVDVKASVARPVAVAG